MNSKNILSEIAYTKVLSIMLIASVLAKVMTSTVACIVVLGLLSLLGEANEIKYFNYSYKKIVSLSSKD